MKNEHVNEEEYGRIDEELYKDVKVKLKDGEHGEEGKGDAEKTVAGHDDATQLTSYDQVKDDEHVTLTTVHDILKTKVPLQSSSISSDFATQFLNLDNVPPVDTKINSMMNIDVHHEEPSNQTPSLLTIPEMKSVKDIINDEVKTQLPQILPKEEADFATLVIQSTITESLKIVILEKSSSQPQSTYEAVASLIEFELKKILLDKIDREDKDKDEDPPARSDQRLKGRKTSKEDEPSKGSKSKESKSSSSKGTKSQPKSSRSDLGNTDDQPNVKAALNHDWFKKPERPSTPDST
ncbi:hypothetical protein Tco_1213381 [Tanacetum coccineum]